MSSLSYRKTPRDLPKETETKKEKPNSRNEKETPLRRNSKFSTERKSNFATLDSKAEERSNRVSKTNTSVDNKRLEKIGNQKIKTTTATLDASHDVISVKNK